VFGNALKLVSPGDEFVEVAIHARSVTSVAKLRPDEALDTALNTQHMAEALGLDLFIAAAHMLIGTVRLLEGRREESEAPLAYAIELAGEALPQVVIAAKAIAAAGERDHNPERSVRLAREALAVEEAADIMPAFRVIAGDLIAWHWARDGRPGDAAIVLEANDELRRRLGFGGLWWAESIREQAWRAVRESLPADRVQELAQRGRAMSIRDLRRLLGDPSYSGARLRK